ncbi:SRPBCC domain-containing protein [Spirillospora sp. NPDC047279]|uniref:SRPBCC domain-containing protein n=1 Tax=Spirillospora sp. NPDC047279 TaxID=3155478 RepID=UPI0033CBB845
MTDHSVKHSTFTLERSYAASPATVFAAWSDRDTKAKWFAAEDGRYSLDFRVGGTEAVHGGGDGAGLVARSEYRDIVPDERIVYTTALYTDEVLSTVSLTTVQFVRDDAGTRLVLTEQGTFLDDREQPEWREQGTGDWLDALGRLVAPR